MGTNDQVRKFGMRDKLGYMFGDFGNDFTFILSSSYLLKFYTDIMGVPAFVVGVIMMIARFVDAFTDVAMGRICDRSRMTPVGKFKPWIRRMCAPVAIASFLIYQSGLAGMPMAFKIGYLFVTYILWGSIFYTSINIPYGSMASAVSPEPGDRQSLSTFRTMGGTLAGLIIGAGVPMVAYDSIDGNSVLNGGRFTIIAGVFSLLAVGCYLLCYALTTERVKTEASAEAMENNSIGKMFINAFQNRALITDVIDYSEIKNGIREDGSVYALYSFARKLGQAASAGLSGALLSLVGYTQETAFDTGVISGIFNISTLVPALGFALLAGVLWFWYPLHKAEVDKNVEILKQKHGK